MRPIRAAPPTEAGKLLYADQVHEIICGYLPYLGTPAAQPLELELPALESQQNFLL